LRKVRDVVCDRITGVDHCCGNGSGRHRFDDHRGQCGGGGAHGHGFGPRIREGLRRRLDRRLGLPLFDTDIPRAAPRTNYPPLLLVHDPDSPYATSERIIEARPGAQLVKTRGLGRLAHYRILRHRPAIRAGVDFMGPAPAVCGGDEMKTSAM
jgi:hypothetical protein